MRYSRQTLSLGVLGAVAAGYGAYERNVYASGPAAVTRLGSWDLVLQIVCSPQFIAFAVAPLWLVLSVSKASSVRTPERMLRFGTRLSILRGELWNSAVSYSVGAGVAVVAVGVVAVGLPWAAVGYPGTASQVFREFRMVPVAALLLQVALLGTTFISIRGLLVSVQIIAKKWWIDITLAVATWVWVATSVAGYVPIAMVDARNYLDLTRLLGDSQLGVMVVITLSSVLAFQFICMSRLDNAFDWRPKWSVSWIPVVLAALAGLVPYGSLGLGLDSAFFGPSGTPLQFLFYLSVVVFISLQAHLRLDRHGGFEELVQLRIGKKSTWLFMLARREALNSIKLWFLVLAAFFVAQLAVRGRSLSFDGISFEQVWILLVHGPVLFVAVAALAVLLHDSIRGPIAALVSQGILMIGMVAFAKVTLNPVSAAAIALTAYGWAEILKSLILLIATFVLLVVGLFLRSNVLKVGGAS